MSYSVFISHSGEDTWIAQRIERECDSINVESFLDEARIAVGARFEDEILDALRKAAELVVLITPWALTRSYIWLEIGAAWLRGIPIVVVLLGVTASEFRERGNIPIALKERNLIHLNQVDKYFNELQVRANGAIA